MVAEGQSSIKWVLGVSSTSSPVSVVWLDPNGIEISKMRHSLVVEENKNDRSKVRKLTLYFIDEAVDSGPWPSGYGRRGCKFLILN